MQRPRLAGQQLARACGQIVELDGQVEVVQGGEVGQQELLLLLKERALYWRQVVHGTLAG